VSRAGAAGGTALILAAALGVAWALERFPAATAGMIAAAAVYRRLRQAQSSDVVSAYGRVMSSQSVTREQNPVVRLREKPFRA